MEIQVPITIQHIITIMHAEQSEDDYIKMVKDSETALELEYIPLTEKTAEIYKQGKEKAYAEFDKHQVIRVEFYEDDEYRFKKFIQPLDGGEHKFEKDYKIRIFAIKQPQQ